MTAEEAPESLTSSSSEAAVLAEERPHIARDHSMTVKEVFQITTTPTLTSQVSALSVPDGGKDVDTPKSTRSVQVIVPDQHNPVPTFDRTNGKTLQSQASNLSTKTSLTFGGQESLPPLPIPSLDETLSKFLKCLEALQDESQRDEAQRIVLDFLKGDGPKLQALLLEYDAQGRADGTIGSYVEEFWNDSYLAPDASVVLNLNPFFVLEDSPDPKIAKDPVRRAASLCFASVKLASQLRSESIEPDRHRGGEPLCMDQFKALFGAARIPRKDCKDSIHVFEESNHVAVLCRSQIYYFQALWPDGNVAVDEGDLVDILAAIRSHAHDLDLPECSKTAVGVLTSLPRRDWAIAREELAQIPKNRESLEIVDSALFVLVLNDYTPKNKHDAASNMLHGSYDVQNSGSDFFSDYQAGSCCNRWYDKLQIIVCGDATAGINFEHSVIDGHTALRFVSDIYAETVISFAQSIVQMVHAHDTVSNVIQATVKRAAVSLDEAGRTTLDVFPKKIPFDIPESVRHKIYFGETALGDEIVASEMYTLEFKDYGKCFIKKNKLSPDSYVQMSMMLAYYKLYGQIVCAYEPVLTKSFFHGRTEAMRPATPEAKRLCEVFCDPHATTNVKLEALRTATKAHSKLVKECAAGKGVDRHLFALREIAKKNNLPVPSFFSEEPWRVLNHTVLSTSNCGNPSLAQFGFGPVVPDGLGIGYIIKENVIHYAISSKHRQTTRYAQNLQAVLMDMADLLEPATETSVKEERLHPDQRTSLKDIPLDKIDFGDSYGDFWGESSMQIPPRTVPESVPEMDGEESLPPSDPPQRRWEAGDEDNHVDEDCEQDEIVKLEDGTANGQKDDSAVPRPKMKRRGSKDFMPMIPGRRDSMVGQAFQRKPSFELRELSKKGSAIDMATSTPSGGLLEPSNINGDDNTM